MKIYACTSPLSMCVCEVSRKNDISCGQCKKGKINTIKYLVFNIKIYLFYVGQTICRFFVKQLYAHVTCEDVRANFSFFFNISKYVKCYIQIKETYDLGVKTPFPKPSKSYFH
jgi:hypothetical protein